MTQKWNLQDIRRPDAPRRTKRTDIEPSPHAKVVENREETEDVHVRIVDGKKKNVRTYLYLFITVFVIIGGAFFISYLRSGADIIVYPRHREPQLSTTIEAFKTPTADALSYEILAIEETGEQQVTASGQETVTTQAAGTIFVYNRHSTEPMRLITNTRFESPEGLIFRLKDSIVIPGYSRAEDGTIAPGMITAEVFADQVGDQYNIAPTTFTIPGFANSPEYENVTAESVDHMRGGFDGPRFIIDEATLAEKQQELRMALRNTLLSRIESERPAGFTHFPGAITFTYETLPAVEFGDNIATIKERAVLRLPIFKDEEFASYVARLSVPGYERQSPVRIDDINELTFSYTSATTSVTNIELQNSLEFVLEGRPLIVWTFDEDAFRNDMAGKSQTATTAVLNGYPGIEKTEVAIRPFYKNSFPDDVSKITVIEFIESRDSSE